MNDAAPSPSDDKPPLKEAEDNPWYLLATVYGEQTDRGFDRELYAKNRKAWHKWMLQGLSAEKIETLRAANKEIVGEFERATHEELDEIKTAFRNRARARAIDLPMQGSGFGAAGVIFRKSFGLGSFVMPGGADFSSATFSGSADFSSATFSGSADFSSATFSGSADFESAMFSGFANFWYATFSSFADFGSATFFGLADFGSATFSEAVNCEAATFFGAEFTSATFSDDAVFLSATFSRYVIFESATFSGYAAFSSATFSGENSWSNAKFNSETDFRAARFEESAPAFFGATLHEGTFWPKRDAWPLPRERHFSDDFVAAYGSLKRHMEAHKRQNDELEFYCLELQSRAVAEGGAQGALINLYGLISDYGRSITAPLTAFLSVTIAGWLVIATDRAFALDYSPIRYLGMSLANMFGPLGFRRELVDAKAYEGLHWLTQAFSAFQTLAGIGLLFLIGLALRNRFRMK